MSVSDGKKQKNQGVRNKLPEQHNNISTSVDISTFTRPGFGIGPFPEA